MRRTLNRSLFGFASAFLATAAQAEDQPKTVVWTAYDLNSGGYAQAVAMGGALRQEAGITLRLLPAQNALSRLAPVREGKAAFAANGLGTYMAQEGAFTFAHPDWGPQNLRIAMMNVGDFCMTPYARLIWGSRQPMT